MSKSVENAKSADCKSCGMPAVQCWVRKQAANGTPCCDGCDHAE